MKKSLFILFAILLSSCKLYTVVVLEKIKPGDTTPYPIKDTTSNAVKIYILDNSKTMWSRDKNKFVEFEVGDTLDCYFKEYKLK
jgi:hypothetical protein